MTYSKSAKNKIVVLADLPYSIVPNIGTISSNYLFPIIGRLNTEPAFYLHSDGSIFQLFQLNELTMPNVDKMIENMPEDSTIQLYRIHKENEKNDKFFFSIRVGIDYSFIDLDGKKMFDNLFGSYKVYGNELDKITKERFASAIKMLPENSRRMDLENNELYEYLCDYECEKDFGYSKYPIKSNISAILTGKASHSCIFSINNLDAIPIKRGILSEHSFLEIITLVKPSKDQKAEIEKKISLNKDILNAIRPPEHTKREVEVDTMEKDVRQIISDIKAGILFINVSFCLKSETSLSNLRERFMKFEETMLNTGIVLYCHSNSARAQYISLFPGNGLYGEHWNKAYKMFGLMLTSKVMGL